MNSHWPVHFFAANYILFVILLRHKVGMITYFHIHVPGRVWLSLSFPYGTPLACGTHYLRNRAILKRQRRNLGPKDFGVLLSVNKCLQSWNNFLKRERERMETKDQLEKPSGVSRYKVSYRGVSQGLQKLYIPGSDGESRNILNVLRIREYGHSQHPFTMTLYPDPTQLGHPVRVVTDLNCPYGIAFNSRGEMIVSERGGHQIAIIDIRGLRIRTYGSYIKQMNRHAIIGPG